jgi:hypothetical protein
LRNTPGGGLNKREDIDAIDDANLVVAHLDLLHQRSDDLATRRPIGMLQALLQLLSELLKFADHEPQL